MKRLHSWSALACAALLSAAGCGTDLEIPMKRYQPAGKWIIDGAEAASLLERGALFLDARDSAEAYLANHVKGALPVAWSRFSQPNDPERGRLLADTAELEQRLRSIGVRADRPVVVVGAPVDGWGEDGRMVWTLRALGHRMAYLVDGGYHALLEAGLPLEPGPPDSVPPGDFVIKPDPTLGVGASELEALVAAGKTTDGSVRLIDTREPGEFAGLTPYGESRGGHVPGAVNLYFEDLLNTGGYLLPNEVLRGKLASRGLNDTVPIIAYCTGGVRSAWFVSVLADLGYTDVRNYAGSMWEWSSLPPAEHPLETP